jgi:DNA-directed RNA polymerase specialized sigma subunit
MELDDFPSPIIPEKIDYKSKDMELYNQWAKTKSRTDMTNLVNHLSPLIYREVSRAAGTLPITALNAEGKNWAIQAVETFKPEKGFALSTHVTNYLQRVRRLNAKYQLAARLPENMKYDWNKYNNSLQQLTEEHNREPTEEEMAAHLGWSKGLVAKFKKRTYSDLLEGSQEHATEVSQFSDDTLLMNALISRLSEEEKTILYNKGKMNATQLAAKLGVNSNRLNYLQNKLVDKITALKRELRL